MEYFKTQLVSLPGIFLIVLRIEEHHERIMHEVTTVGIVYVAGPRKLLAINIPGKDYNRLVGEKFQLARAITKCQQQRDAGSEDNRKKLGHFEDS